MCVCVCVCVSLCVCVCVCVCVFESVSSHLDWCESLIITESWISSFYQRVFFVSTGLVSIWS